MWSQVGLRKHHYKQSWLDRLCWAIQLSCFKSYKMMLWKCCTQYATKFGKLSSGLRTGKVFIQIPKKGNAKECSNYRTVALISHASKIMLKILQVDFNIMWTVNFQMFKLYLERVEETEIKLPTSIGPSKKRESSRKKHLFLLKIMPKPLTVCITTNCGKFLKRWKYQTTWSSSFK